ncbi:DUF4174 domain-containing protein [Hyunsoonleella sp. 2307UL5-6]|uniref:DUF4174 domain-containing protein n=1 Tax=Hyunsoonleella sp. 2307UL5-6 TaxID=3384768 RepID=UPI0039BCD29A
MRCIIVLIFISTNLIYTQDIASLKWKHRILIIETNTLTNPVYVEQIEHLALHAADLKDRKLIIYQFNQDKYRLGINSKTTWKPTTTKIKKTHLEYEITLIGLDGSVKLKQNSFLKTDTLFSIIDAMPMRQLEIIQNKK